MSCPHGVWHSEDCETCRKDEELDRLRALTQQQAEQIAELKRDAERYRFIRDPNQLVADCYVGGMDPFCDKRLDAAIDAALAKPMPKAMRGEKE